MDKGDKVDGDVIFRHSGQLAMHLQSEPSFREFNTVVTTQPSYECPLLQCISELEEMAAWTNTLFDVYRPEHEPRNEETLGVGDRNRTTGKVFAGRLDPFLPSDRNRVTGKERNSSKMVQQPV
jgi:hypothetical protein